MKALIHFEWSEENVMMRWCQDMKNEKIISKEERKKNKSKQGRKKTWELWVSKDEIKKETSKNYESTRPIHLKKKTDSQWTWTSLILGSQPVTCLIKSKSSMSCRRFCTVIPLFQNNNSKGMSSLGPVVLSSRTKGQLINH